MYLLIAADIFPPESGGPATYCVTLANELVKKGYKVIVVSLNPNSDKTKLNGSEVFAVKSRFKPLRYWQYYKLLLKHGRDADIIYAMGPVNAGYPALRAAKKLGKKFVVKVVGDYAWEQGQVLGLVKDSIDDFQKKQYGGKIGGLQKIEKKVVRAADLVITPSDYLKNMVIGWGASEGKVKKIYNAVQLPLDVKPVAKPAGERWIVSVGRLVPWKNVEFIMKAIKELGWSDLKLKVIGDGPERIRLEQIRIEHNLGEVVEFLGNLPHDSALQYMAAADLVALDSGYEGLSHVLLEARFLGRPAIASRVGGNPEVIREEDHLFTWRAVVELRKAIEVIINRPVEGMPAEFATFFSFGKMVEDTKKALSEVCVN